MKWLSVPLGELCELHNGKAFKESDWTKTGLPIIRIQNLNGRGAAFNHWAGSLSGQVKVKAGDLLLAWSGTPGTSFGAHIWSGPAGVLNQHIFRIDLDLGRIDPRWAVKAINQQLNRLIDLAHGGVGLKHVTRGTVEGIIVPLPSLAEQRRIAAILDQAEALRAKRRQALAKLDTLTQSLFLDMFGDPLGEMTMLPRVSLGEIIEFIGGSQPPKSVFGDKPGDGWVRLVQIRDFRTDRYQTFIPRALARRSFGHDDVMIGRYGPPVFQIFRGLSGSYNVALMKALPKGLVLKTFIYQLLRFPSIQRLVIENSERTAGQSGVNLGFLEKVVVPLPSLESQERFEKIETSFLRLHNIFDTQSRNIEALVSSLQHRAFRGEL